MVLAGTLGKVTTLATSARLACAAASTVIVVALQITAPPPRAARHHLVAAQVRFSSPELLSRWYWDSENEHTGSSGRISARQNQAVRGEKSEPRDVCT